MTQAIGGVMDVAGRRHGTARTRAVSFALLWAMVLLLASFGASAQRVEGDRAGAAGMYAAEVEVNSQGDAERRQAFGRALAQVLGKLSGDRGSASAPGVANELRQAAQYVDGYDYRQDEGRSASGAPTFKTILVVRFDEDKVDALTAALGLPVWPTPRPKPVMWLAIDDGSGPRLVGLPQADAARPTLDRAVQRGYRLGLPEGSAAEQAVVGAIWRGDTSAVARASSRYNPPMQLVGKLYRHQGGWKADWTFIDDGRVLSQWSENGASARQVLATGADGAADALVKRYAKRTETGPAGTYRVAFTGIDNAEDYLRLSGYLQGLAVVRAIVPVQVTATAAEFDLELVSGVAGLNLMIEGDGVLEQVGGFAPAADAAVPEAGVDGLGLPSPASRGQTPLYRVR